MMHPGEYLPFYPGTRRRIKFNYKNWRDEEHEYDILIEAIEFGPFDKGGINPEKDLVDDWIWVMHGHVVTRDGDERRDMGPVRRRTFIMSDMRLVEEVT